MRNPGGVGTIIDPTLHPTTPFQECDSFTCGHCQTVVWVPPRQDPAEIGGMCKMCMHLICPVCVGRMVCVTWEQMMEMQESRSATFRSIEDTLGRNINDPSLV